ncbi:MAG: asparagine synthase (glutamine-hydrolyzing) [Vicinamibacteria bacterium]
MCGIAGILSLDGAPVPGHELRRMCDALRHRGPDGAGYHLTPELGLGMRRLSIIDLETGDQPVTNEDGSVCVVFNGEIYNYRELTRELRGRGHAFRTCGDTETIAHLYEERGAACVDRLRGMFAFACWDARQRTLLLARDRLGIKPLYYVETQGRLAFASELKALLQLAWVERRLDWQAFGHLLAFLTTPESQSILSGIHKLPPGHRLLASPGGGLRVERYWQVRFEPARDRTQDSLAEELRALLEEAVRLHMIGDVPVGAFLSGGVDSSAVVGQMARLAGGPLKTFSIGFADDAFSEVAEAGRTARRLGTEHHELVLEPEALDVIEHVVRALDEPFGDPSAIPTFMVSRLAAQHVKVALSGDGGDELFAGYDRYRVESRERAWRLLPRPAGRLLGAAAARLPHGLRGRRFLRHVALPGPERYLDAVTLFDRDLQRRLLRPELRERLGAYDPWRAEAGRITAAGGHWLSALQELDLRAYLPLDILTKVDRMSMAHSLEARPPLLDHPLVEFAARVPPELQLRGGETKWLFRRALAGLVPAEVLARPKRGFAIPLGRWFRGELRGFVRELLLSRDSRCCEVFARAQLERFVERQDPRDSFGFPLFTLISFELWCRAFMGSLPLAAPAPLGDGETAGRAQPVVRVAAAL